LLVLLVLFVEPLRQVNSRATRGGDQAAGWGQERDRQRSAEAGFDRHLVKPAEPAEIAALIRTRWAA
jgi:hypothetical protein